MATDMELLASALTLVLGVVTSHFARKYVKLKNVTSGVADVIAEINETLKDYKVTPEELVAVKEKIEMLAKGLEELFSPSV